MQQPNQKQAMADSEVLLAGIGVIFLVVVVYYMIMQQIPAINAFIGALAWAHTWIFAKLGLHFPSLVSTPFLGPWLFKPAIWSNLFLEQGNFAYMNGEQRNLVLIASGRTALIYYGWLIVLLIPASRNLRVDLKYRTLHTLESLIWWHSGEWVTSRVARHVDPRKFTDVSPRMLASAGAKALARKTKGDMPSGLVSVGAVSLSPGAWARSLRPEEYLLSTGATVDIDTISQAQAGEIEDERVYECRANWERLDLDVVGDLFASQLRTPWQGAKKLRPHLRALFAVMAQFYAYDVKGGNKLLERVALVADGCQVKPGKMDEAIAAEKDLLKTIDKIIDSKPGRKLEALANGRHAYVESAMPTLLAAARKDRGVLACASFTWLKAQDRLMWYILNAVGNEAINVEAAGAHAHNRSEIQIGKKLVRPAVYQASRALLEDYLDLTEERIVVRHQREERRRKFGTQLDMTLSEVRQRLDQEGSEK